MHAHQTPPLQSPRDMNAGGLGLTTGTPCNPRLLTRARGPGDEGLADLPGLEVARGLDVIPLLLQERVEAVMCVGTANQIGHLSTQTWLSCQGRVLLTPSSSRPSVPSRPSSGSYLHEYGHHNRGEGTHTPTRLAPSKQRDDLPTAIFPGAQASGVACAGPGSSG
jgi:hypothetical protein